MLQIGQVIKNLTVDGVNPILVQIQIFQMWQAVKDTRPQSFQVIVIQQ